MARAFANASTYTVIEREMVGAVQTVPRVVARFGIGAVKSLQIPLGVVPMGRERATVALVAAARGCGRLHGLFGLRTARYSHD